jgi:exopolyphosphatase/guanosine-5'-triphosphate,3'-diphosphate pyrophosphatase
MADSPRYEFRIWADDLGAQRRRLDASGVHQRSAESTEIYLLSRTTDCCNAKIRNGLLDVKRLLRELRGLQQWTPLLKAPFPLDAATLATCFSCLAGGAPPHLATVATQDAFLREVIAPSRLLVAAEIAKRREVFTLDGCIAEFAAVSAAAFPGTVRHSIALESDDPERVLALAAELEIEAYPNRSYVQELKQRLGVAPL